MYDPVADSIEMFESASLFASEDGLQWSHVSDIGLMITMNLISTSRRRGGCWLSVEQVLL